MRKRLEIAYWFALTASIVVIVWFTAKGGADLLRAWKVTIPIVINLVLAAAVSVPSLLRKQSNNVRFVFVPFVFTAGIILYGFLNTNRDDVIHPRAMILLYTLLGLQLVAVLYHAVVAKGFRWLSLSVGLFSIWLSVSVGFTVAMMVTGDWI